MFQQHHGESLSEAWTRFKDLLQKVPHHGIDLWLQVQIFYDHVNPVTRRTIDQSAGGKLRDLNAEESWALLEDLALYDNESWNDPRDFAKPVKAIALPQDVPSTSDRRLIELENQVQRLMEAHLAPTRPTQVNKITTQCEICSGPHDTQYCMENPKQAFVEYASSRTDEAGGGDNLKNGTWLLVPRPAGVNMVSSMWFFKHKFHADGTLSGYKARLVANGSSQQLGFDFYKTFSQVVKPATIRTVLSLVVSLQWPIHQLDVKNAFLNGDLSKSVYMHRPSGFVENRFLSSPTSADYRGLQYLTFTRPDLSYAVQQICLYMHDPRELHLVALVTFRIF
ncbi:MAK10-like protein, partial [Tanacetum coccineum]